MTPKLSVQEAVAALLKGLPAGTTVTLPVEVVKALLDVKEEPRPQAMSEYERRGIALGRQSWGLR